MRRLVWVTVGAVGGVLAYRKAQEVLEDARDRGVVLSAQQEVPLMTLEQVPFTRRQGMELVPPIPCPFEISYDGGQDRLAVDLGRVEPLDVLHHKDRGLELLDDCQVFLVQEVPMVGLEAVVVLHARPTHKRVSLAGRTADQNPFLYTTESGTDAAAYLQVISTQFKVAGLGLRVPPLLQLGKLGNSRLALRKIISGEEIQVSLGELVVRLSPLTVKSP